MKLTFLGTGTSCGVPTIGCQCPTCSSQDPHDKRLRCSALLEEGDTRLLIDCGPDFRQQIMPLPFSRIDGVLITHAHYDHVGGLDDVRPFCQFGEVNVYADPIARQSLLKMLPYCFEEHRYPNTPVIRLHEIHPHEVFNINGIDIMPIQVMHHDLPLLGYRIGGLTYITDMKTIADSELEYLKGTEVLVVNALRRTPHHSHQTLDEAVAFAKKIGARQTWLTHAAHSIGKHDEVNNILPPHIRMAYDGLVVNI